MGYEVAINKAWDDLLNLNPSPAKNLLIKFLADEYSIDIKGRKIFSSSCNVVAKDFVSILDQCECNDNHNYPIPQAVPLSRKNLCDQCFGEKHIMIFKNGRWTCENKSF